jgi:hypothetical protein
MRLFNAFASPVSSRASRAAPLALTITLTLALALTLLAGCSSHAPPSSGGTQEVPVAPAEPQPGSVEPSPALPGSTPATPAGEPTPPTPAEPSKDPGALDPAGVATLDCDPGKIRCRRMTPSCPEGQVPSIEGSCYGPCVPVAKCACTAAAQCPQSDKHTCHSSKHCGPYVR